MAEIPAMLPLSEQLPKEEEKGSRWSCWDWMIVHRGGKEHCEGAGESGSWLGVELGKGMRGTYSVVLMNKHESPN